MKEENHLESLIRVFKSDYKFMERALKAIKGECDRDRYIDVRLCCDVDEYGDASWIVRSGDASYDQAHSQYCGASSVDSNTEVLVILEDLIDQCLDQAGESEGE